MLVAMRLGAGVFSTEERRGRKCFSYRAAAHTTRSEPPGPISRGLAGGCAARFAPCLVQQLAYLDRLIPGVRRMERSGCRRRGLCRAVRTGSSPAAPREELSRPCWPWGRLHPLGVVPGGFERESRTAGPTAARKSPAAFLCRKDNGGEKSTFVHMAPTMGAPI